MLQRSLLHVPIPPAPHGPGTLPGPDRLLPRSPPPRPRPAGMNDIDGVPGLVLCAGPRGRVAVCTDGQTLRRVPSGVPFAELSGAWAGAPDLAYAVGSLGAVLRWDGARLAQVPTGTLRNLFAVWGCGAEVWIGGAGVLLHLRGGKMVRHDIDQWVTRIWGSGPRDVWFLGPKRRCLRWDGHALWPVILAAAEERERPELHDIGGTGRDDVWAVGAGGCILRGGAQGWRRVPAMTGAALHGICHTAGGEVYVITGTGQLRRGVDVARGVWTVAADFSGLGGALYGVCAVGETVWCCGLPGVFRHERQGHERGDA